jgi:hypothetical protein
MASMMMIAVMITDVMIGSIVVANLLFDFVVPVLSEVVLLS